MKLDDHTMLVQMHTELIGLGNGGGMIREHKIMQKDISHIKETMPNMVTHKHCKKSRTEMHTEHSKKFTDYILFKERRKANKLSIFIALVGLVGTVSGVIIKTLVSG